MLNRSSVPGRIVASALSAAAMAILGYRVSALGTFGGLTQFAISHIGRDRNRRLQLVVAAAELFEEQTGEPRVGARDRALNCSSFTC